MGLRRFAWLSIAAAVTTIALKLLAWWLTDSVGLLSDALESVVNLVAAVMTLWMLALAARPADEEHPFGYSKAEYFASGLEGSLICLAAAAISWTAIERLLHPRALESVGVGLVVSVAASLVNFAAARVLLKAARRHGSIALEADAHHLLTDVWTSVGVVVGVAIVWSTGWRWADPVLALAVAANIVFTGWSLMRRSIGGLMDRAVSPEARGAIAEVLARYRQEGIEFHALRARAAAGRSFISVHVLVPGEWTVQRGHDMAESIEREMERAVPGALVTTHLEPREDPASYLDDGLDRKPR